MSKIGGDDKVVMILVLVPLILFGGTPDLMDAIIEFLREYNDE